MTSRATASFPDVRVSYVSQGRWGTEIGVLKRERQVSQ